MKIEQIYTGCLAHGAYYIESNGEAAIVDPLRESAPYLQRAQADHAKIKYVLETHFHADFVSGHLDLAKQTGATIVFGPTAQPAFDAHVAQDGELLSLGKIKIKVLHTPGHTMESSCFLVIDEQGREYALFSGDTLFIGDVGRPDLAQKGAITQEVLAGYLFDSLRNKVMTLPDDVIVYPGHGAGSACGKNMSNETTDTLAHQKASNYALRADMTREDFVKEVITGLMPPPAYFPKNAAMNKMGYESFTEVMKRGARPLNADAFELVAGETGALLLDTRQPDEFIKGFIPNSINIGMDGSFAPWAGALIPDLKQEILLVTEPGREEEAITRLARVGYDFSIGFLEGGFEAWKKAGKETDSIESVSAAELAGICRENSNVSILDVRKKSEYDAEHLIDAVNAPLDYINDSMTKINRNAPTYIHCAGGYRSVIFISILKARGFHNLVDVRGGFKALKESGKFKVSEYVAPNTML
ncbi:MAG: MBL fold metallo-hydrolase [Bacteroidia bacterium]|nr:MBL fold metallo-hydrolase [Bacteroidia bacterium]